MTSISRLLVTGTICAATASGCGSSSSDAPAEAPLGVTETTLRVQTGIHTVQPGDAFECFYTDVITSDVLYANHANGSQGPGGHHITVYYVNGPQQPVGHHPCDDAEMINWRQVAATSADGGQSAEGAGALPPGTASKIPAGKQIVIQAHYINASASPRDVQDDITVALLRASEVKHIATGMAILDGTFSIPPQSSIKHTSIAVADRDYDVISAIGHMHQWGSHFTLERLDDAGNSVDTIIDNQWEPAFTSHPPERHWPVEGAYHIPKGTKLRQTCEWHNDTSDTMGFPREMCVTFNWFVGDTEFNVLDAKATDAQ